MILDNYNYNLCLFINNLFCNVDVHTNREECGILTAINGKNKMYYTVMSF